MKYDENGDPIIFEQTVDFETETVVGPSPSSLASLPEFTCEEIGGVFALWWGDGKYIWGWELSKRRDVESLCRCLNEKREALAQNAQNLPSAGGDQSKTQKGN